MDPHVVYYLISTIHLSFLQPINRGYSRLSFDYITYSANNTGERCFFVIYQHKGKWNSLIFIPLLFCLSHQKHIQDIISWLFIIVLHFVYIFCDTSQFLINTVIIVTSFVWGQHSAFFVAIGTYECVILILQKLWFCVWHRY